MRAQEAFDSLDPHAWAETPATERLALIKALQKNLKAYARELGQVDAAMKNGEIGEETVSDAEGVATTVTAMASRLMGARRMYEPNHGHD